MATQAAPQPDARRRFADYRNRAGTDDVAANGDAAAWTDLFAALGDTAAGNDGDGATARLPLLIGAREWAHIGRGIVQRAELLETVTADLYGPGALVARGRVPAALVTGSAGFLRPMVGVTPPGGWHLHVVAMDLARGPAGEWRVLADHLTAPAGAGRVLANRLATGREFGDLEERLGVAGHAPFFAALRDGIAAPCQRVEPRLALLTQGRNDRGEDARLARQLGMLLVEDADLAALDDRLYIRTIAGMKRVDALWRRVEARLIDPLAFHSHAGAGIAGLIDAYAAGNLVIANAPGAAMLEAPAFAAFLPALAADLTGGDLILPGTATWWCGQPAERAHVVADFDRLTIGAAFAARPLGMAGDTAVFGADVTGARRAALLADLARRPQDYVGREAVRVSTMPVMLDEVPVPRPFTLRVFAARDGSGGWTVLPGGVVRIAAGSDTRAAMLGEGGSDADAWIHGAEPAPTPAPIPVSATQAIRRNPGTLPSRVADNLFWLGRYLERGAALLMAIRTMLDSAGAPGQATIDRLAAVIAETAGSASPPPGSRNDMARLLHSALDGEANQSVAALDRQARRIGEESSDRLPAGMAALLVEAWPAERGLRERVDALQRRHAALEGMSAEHMDRSAAWRFHDLGRRIERALAMVRAARVFGGDAATTDDLATLLDLADGHAGYRQRYPTGLARLAVIDLVVLDPSYPRSIVFQLERIVGHLAALPMLADDGMAEPQQAAANALHAIVATTAAAEVDPALLAECERRLVALSDAIAKRYFLQGAEPLRAAGMTLA